LKSRILKFKMYYLRLISTRSQDSRSLNHQEMTLKYTPLVKHIAYRLAMRLPYIAVDDLISAGVIGLMDALSKFDPEKKVQFKTYAEFRIKGEMLDEIRSMDWVSRSVRHKASQLAKTFRTLEQKRGRSVEDEEVALELGLSLEKYYKTVNEINGVFPMDIERLPQKSPPFSDDDDDDLVNLIIDEKENHPFHLLSQVELKKMLAQAIEELSTKERTVISLYYYEELRLKEIGQVLGFTESRICQIHTKGILKLRSRMQCYLKDVGQKKIEGFQMSIKPHEVVHFGRDSFGG
jgi:RNA polymerase sigma factor for flagellar operon FliA